MADFYIVTATKNGEIIFCQFFEDRGQAIGFADSKFGLCDPEECEAVVFSMYEDTGEGVPVHYVDMPEVENTHQIEYEDDVELEYLYNQKQRPKKTKIKKPIEFELVDVSASRPKHNRNIKKGTLVQIEVVTPDSFEKLWVEIEKIVKKKTGYEYRGQLITDPETFIPPKNMEIKFKNANILDVE